MQEGFSMKDLPRLDKVTWGISPLRSTVLKLKQLSLNSFCMQASLAHWCIRSTFAHSLTGEGLHSTCKQRNEQYSMIDKLLVIKRRNNLNSLPLCFNITKWENLRPLLKRIYIFLNCQVSLVPMDTPLKSCIEFLDNHDLDSGDVVKREAYWTLLLKSIYFIPYSCSNFFLHLLHPRGLNGTSTAENG